MLYGEKRVNVQTLTFNSSKKNNVKRYNVNGDKAKYLVEKFERSGCNDADNCYFFFIKCFNNLSEDTIWSIFEASTRNPRIKAPIKYFIGACRNQMALAEKA